MTYAALEQIGNNHEAFIQFLMRKSPLLCVNVECLCELYDDNALVDYLAIKYHKKRNYLDGYLTRLQQLQADGKKSEALALYKELKGDDQPSHVKAAAMKGILTATIKK